MKRKSSLPISICIGLISLSAFAQKNGEIIFSKHMINPSNPAKQSTQFHSGENIYAVAFFDKNILELRGKASAKKVSVEVFIYELKAPLYDYQQPSEIQLETATMWVSGEALQKKYLPIDILPGPNEMTAYGSPLMMYKKFGQKFDGPVKFAERIAKLEPGEHKIIVKLKCNYNVVSEGRFIIQGEDYAAYLNLSTELNEMAANIKTMGAILPKAALSDKKLEAQMIKAFKASQTYKDRVNGKILCIVIIDPDWMIRRNKISGIILHRYIRAAIAVKNDDDTCTVWQNVTFQQDYISNKFQKTKFDGIGDPMKISCENVNK